MIGWILVLTLLVFGLIAKVFGMWAFIGVFIVFAFGALMFVVVTGSDVL